VVQAAAEAWARWRGSFSGIWARVWDARVRAQVKKINEAMRRRIREPFFDVEPKFGRRGLYRKNETGG
jgi:hypothetical protein